MPEARAEASSERRPRNDRRRARNREALIQAATDLAYEQGSGGLTPVAIARRAELHKQVFYVHFKNLDECMTALAQRIGAESLSASELHHAELVLQPVRDRAAELREMCARLELVRAHRTIYRLLASERYSEGPLATAVRDSLNQSRKLWTSVVLELAVRAGIRASALSDIEDLAAIMLEMSLSTSMRVIEDPSLSIEAEATRHLRYTSHLVTRELRELYRRQHAER